MIDTTPHEAASTMVADRDGDFQWAYQDAEKQYWNCAADMSGYWFSVMACIADLERSEIK